ncbi:BNR repeat-containing protein [Ferribacterium limneticum]|uniref:BNR repeat-containing protein n=1 Tax=Ferribacterium limneticum TaxID=76259 RepID=UPI001CFB89CF|nr:BNR repeat-containing protein [Ferribacterium limneticum]UCV18280.1 BNR repeat-containing protein [Ferribacterium limneticum]
METDDFVYLAYYDAERWLTISRVNKCFGKIEKVRLPSRFLGWDSHNFIALALDDDGLLHVSGNMHASQLVYARMARRDDLASLGRLQTMVGREEERATYPNFFRFPDGSLGYSYRFGSSGDGTEIVNRFEAGHWIRWLDQPLFAPAHPNRPVNAYHTGFVRGNDGFFHVAWVWRENFRVETNFHVAYARSRDLKSWQDSRGKALLLPITPQNAEVVDAVPKGSGLFNNVRLGFDGRGKVVISYLKFDARGFSQLFHARREERAWQIAQSSNWTYRWDPRGGGTIQREITFSGVEVRGSDLFERVSQPEIGNAVLKYEPNTLKEVAQVKEERILAPVSLRQSSVPGGMLNRRLLRRADGHISERLAISWLSLPPDNRDMARECASVGGSCHFVSELLLLSLPARTTKFRK